MKRQKQGVALITVMIFGFTLISILSIWFEEKLFVFKLEDNFLSQRFTTIECASLLNSIKQQILDQGMNSFQSANSDFIKIKIDSVEKWRISTLPIQDNQLIYFANFIENPSFFCEAYLDFP